MPMFTKLTLSIKINQNDLANLKGHLTPKGRDSLFMLPVQSSSVPLGFNLILCLAIRAIDLNKTQINCQPLLVLDIISKGGLGHLSLCVLLITFVSFMGKDH